MRAGGTTATIDAHAFDPSAAQRARLEAEERLHWMVATPLIGGVSLGLWLCIWEVARLALGS